jgi:hypothetical protein
MKYDTRLILPSIVIGVGISALFQVLALVAYKAGHPLVTRLLDWPNTLIQAAVSDGSSVNLPGYFASLPLGVAVYGVGAYLFLRSRIRQV